MINYKEKQYLATSGGTIDMSIPTKHGELYLIHSHPDLICDLFENKLKNLTKQNLDTSEYLRKLKRLKNKLDNLIISWI